MGKNLDPQVVATLHLRCHRIIGEQLEMPGSNPLHYGSFPDS
jgi:hypothetical protein